MKVLVVNNMAPFVWGGAEELASHLQKNLVIAGHEAEVLRIPFQWEPAARIPSQMLMARAFEFWNVDHVIALKFPAYLVRHPSKTLWVLHQYRQAYDLHDAGHTNLPAGEQGENIKNLIINADNETFHESKRIFTNSVVTHDRLAHYNGVKSEVLLPPLNDPGLFTGGNSEGYIFAGGRINSMKRQHLLVEALAKIPRVRLVIAGPPDTPDDAKKLCQLKEQLNLGDRLKLDLRFLPRQEYADYVNSAAAVAYIPYDEDSLGYVSMEAATAGKALITASDSGGILGLVKHLQTGWVVEPDTSSIAQAMFAVSESEAKTQAFGRAARVLINSMNLTWAHTVEKLTT